ncbi:MULTISPECIES: glycoside hydrolase family 27 protein [unclassified Sphingomonas]|jgi:alpha-galactosidase|uniref:glycoside hydrolase family 27 protein n=1 Tax=unclassified Sphingomonas TaxID=196159 RepID=UPI000E10973A|nr:MULTISPECIES: glycoside hydrolase family 27 protein [unclassified Sphingomonas]AXJ96230.1 alpha-galactosidase [Sphingomonas sp. FARSPH]
MTPPSRRTVLGAAAALPAISAVAGGASAAAGPALAPTPPMGWNSWNSFAVTITEAEARETAAIMARVLRPAGYDIFTIDHQWYDPRARGYQYNDDIVPVMDGFGRFQPDPVRFPSATDGTGFTRIARDVHAIGLRFGIHRMRGIPRAAVKANLPVFGTPYRARDIADTSSTCSWNVDMYGVDMTKPGAQAYYDGVFAEYARWGVDFVKVDDLSRPYDTHAPEIEGIARAIARCGRPMLLSMSPGETPVVRGDHARRHAHIWRISDDFWDDWALLEAQFVRLENWNPYMGDGRWPDADMLPLGRLAMGARDTRFTPDEQRTLMTLWSIARSPLIMGGDLRHLDDATIALLTNPEVIAVNQASRENRPHFVADSTRIWSAKAVNGDTYLALFNIGKEARDVVLPLAMVGLRGAGVRDLWARRDDGATGGRFARRIAPHGAGLYRLSPR